MSGPAPLRSLWRTPIAPLGFAHLGSLAVSPAGTWVAVGKGFGDSETGSLSLLDLRTGQILREITLPGRVGGVAVGPDDRTIATAEYRSSPPPATGRIRVLDAVTLAERGQHAEPLVQEFFGLCWTPDGRSVTACSFLSSIGATRVFVLDAGSGTERWHHDFTTMFQFVFSPDSSLFVAACNPDGLVVLDALTGAERLTIAGPSPAFGLAISPDGRRIVTRSETGIRVLDRDGGLVWSSSAPASSMTISDDSRLLATAFADGASQTVRGYDLDRGTERFPPVVLPDVQFGNPALLSISANLRHVVVVHAPPGGRSPVTPARHLTVLDARTGRRESTTATPTPTFPNLDLYLAVAPDGCSLVTWNGGVVEAFDLGVEVARCPVDATPVSVEFSPATDPVLLAVATKSADATSSSAVTVFIAATGVRLTRRPVVGTIVTATFTENGQSIAAGSNTGIRLFSLLADRSWTLDTIGAVNALAAVGPDGTWIATAAARTLRLLHTSDGHERWPTPHTHPQTVTRVAASADGTRVATGCADRATRLLDAATGGSLLTVAGQGRVRALVAAPDRPLLATGDEDGVIVLIDASAARERTRITRPFGCAHLALSTGGRLLAAAWDDNAVTVHDLTSPTAPIITRVACPAPVTGLILNSTDDTLLVTTSGQNTITAYDPRTGEQTLRVIGPRPIVDVALTADGALAAYITDQPTASVVRGTATPT